MIEDFEQILRDAETLVQIKYYKTGLFDSNSVIPYNSIFDLPNIGFTFSGDWNRIDNYLVMKKTTDLNIRKVPQRNGDVKIAVDQMINPNSIEIKLGGIFKEKGNIIVAGRVATISEDAASIELYKLFTVKIKKNFKKVGAFYLGKEAEEKLKMSWRLVTNEKSPKEYDLTLS